ncbi:hypothetical protein [Enterobacter roggenkampii]|uniref:hypothetical protein n=1 Tax=Enterobacter roggenkampii TaxID=1812935 RepID=UPI0011BA3139|nr:hypothetical protein [Enterobacter roggenkampii]TWY16725.1 hypothetical protein FR969_21170 [Enterobacter roggenkampii]
MNISNGHNSAQGYTLPEKHNAGAFAYGLSEDGFGKLTRARNACDLLQLLFSEYPSQVGALDTGCAPGVAALMEYLRADLTDIAHSCALIEGGAK